MALALFIGVVVTLAASLEPAWRAGRIPPVEALRRGPAGHGGAGGPAALARPGLRGPGGGGPGDLARVAAAEPWRLGAWSTGSGSGMLGPLAVYGLLLVTVLLVPRLLRPCSCGWRASRSGSSATRSAWRAAPLHRDRSRTALTAGALVVGLAMVVALGTAAQDVRKIGSSWLAETIPGSELLTSIRPVATTDPIRGQLAAVAGVKSVSPIGLFGVPYRGVRQEAAAIVGRDYLADGRLIFVAGGGDRTAALNALDAGGSVIVPQVAGRPDRHPGRRHPGVRHRPRRPPGCEWWGSSPTRSRPVPRRRFSSDGLTRWASSASRGRTSIAVRYAPGQESSSRGALDATARQYALESADLGRVEGTVGDALERVFRLLDALALIAVLVAGLGMANTYSMSVLERVREIGVLRATGMTSGQVWGMVVVEAGLLGVFGAVVGAIVGVVAGALLVGWSSAGFGVVFEPPWVSIGLAMVFGVLISVAASIYPAGLASRISIVRALQHE